MKLKIKTLMLIGLIGLLPQIALANCPQGFTPCSHRCPDSARPNCGDLRGTNGESCIRNGYCQNAPAAKSNCEQGWTERAQRCSDRERQNGCKDKRGNNGVTCIQF